MSGGDWFAFAFIELLVLLVYKRLYRELRGWR